MSTTWNMLPPGIAITADDIKTRLSMLGYRVGHDSSLEDRDVRFAVRSFQARHDLRMTETLDDITVGRLFTPRCGLPDAIRDPESAACKWPMLDVTASHKLAPLNPLATEREHAIYLQALAAWNAVCGIRLKFVDQFPKTNIYTEVAPTGAGVLAWSYLPCGASQSTSLRQWFNPSTNWSESLLLNTLIHELGHAIGLDHGPTGSIMQPYADGRITKPQAWDIDQVVSRYGRPAPQPPKDEPPVNNPPTTPNPDDPVGTIRIDVPGLYRLVRVAGDGWDMG